MPAFGVHSIPPFPRLAGGLFLLLALPALLAGCDQLLREKKDKKAGRRTEQELSAHDQCLHKAIAADKKGKPWGYGFREEGEIGEKKWQFNFQTDGDGYYGGWCDRVWLRGCRLPPEEYSVVEEFKYRLRHCPKFVSCDEFALQAAALDEEKRELHSRKNEACRAVFKMSEAVNQKVREDARWKAIEEAREQEKAGSWRCTYEMRRLTSVIDAAARLEAAYEEHCGYWNDGDGRE